MADEIYSIENNSNDILITVKVSTPGVANSKIFRIPPGGDPIAESDATGSIPQKFIAKANVLNNTLIKTNTDIDLGTVPETSWQTIFDNLVIKYTMDGGKNGTKMFSCDATDKSQSPDKRFIRVEKRITLIQS